MQRSGNKSGAVAAATGQTHFINPQLSGPLLKSHRLHKGAIMGDSNPTITANEMQQIFIKAVSFNVWIRHFNGIHSLLGSELDKKLLEKVGGNENKKNLLLKLCNLNLCSLAD